MNREMIETVVRTSLRSEVESVTPPFDLVGELLPRLGNRVHRKWWSVLFPRTRLAWVVCALVVALIGGTAYGATSLVREMMRSLAPDIETGELITWLDLSQTIDDVTVTIDAGYADANTVLLGYTITGKNALYDDDFARHLYLADGMELEGMAGMGYITTPDILGWKPSISAAIAAFDGTAIQDGSSEISLRFETTPSDKPMSGQVSGYGPFIFDFTLPFHGGTNIVVGQTVEAAGIPITLEKVLISPAGTSAVFSFTPEFEQTRQRIMMTTSLELPLSADNSPTESIHEATCQIQESDTVTFYRGNFTGHLGTWTLTVNELVNIPRTPADSTDYEGKVSDIQRTEGPWVFRFTVGS